MQLKPEEGDPSRWLFTESDIEHFIEIEKARVCRHFRALNPAHPGPLPGSASRLRPRSSPRPRGAPRPHRVNASPVQLQRRPHLKLHPRSPNSALGGPGPTPAPTETARATSRATSAHAPHGHTGRARSLVSAAPSPAPNMAAPLPPPVARTITSPQRRTTQRPLYSPTRSSWRTGEQGKHGKKWQGES